jgi:hypothetical protein
VVVGQVVDGDAPMFSNMEAKICCSIKINKSESQIQKKPTYSPHHKIMVKI